METKRVAKYLNNAPTSISGTQTLSQILAKQTKMADRLAEQTKMSQRSDQMPSKSKTVMIPLAKYGKRAGQRDTRHFSGGNTKPVHEIFAQ